MFCQSFTFFRDFYEIYSDGSLMEQMYNGKVPLWIMIIISVSNLMIGLNSATNFLIYILRREQFRKFWYETYCCYSKRDLYYDG